MTQRALVTGGAGFLGSHLCDALVARGEHVICLDNLFTGRKENVSHLSDCPNFEFIEHDVMQPIDIEVDLIYNLACPAAPGHYQHDPVNTTMTSILGAVHTLELAKKYNAKLFHTSTSEVYGDPLVHPQPESYRGNVNPIGLRACYDEGKRAAESIMFDYHRMYGVDIRVVRIFNTYGPRMHPFDGRVVSTFIRQAIAGENLTIFGDGKQSRSFCYVDDLIKGFLLMMDADEATGPINMGNPCEFTMLELAEIVLSLTESKSELIMKPIPADDPNMRQPDITLATEKLGWVPTVPLAEGLAKLIAWFSEINIDEWPPPTPNWAGGLTDAK